MKTGKPAVGNFEFAGTVVGLELESEVTLGRVGAAVPAFPSVLWIVGNGLGASGSVEDGSLGSEGS
jgi:hypothetical protein